MFFKKKANVCVNESASGLPIACDSNLTPCLECGIPGCYTGLPLQPAGYGPPDNISFSIPSVPDYAMCEETNPQSIRRFDVGDGPVLCAGVAYYVNLYVLFISHDFSVLEMGGFQNIVILCENFAHTNKTKTTSVGDSNVPTSTAHFDFAPAEKWTCSNGSTITASGSVDFEIACTRDAQNNATCVIPANETVVIPVLSYEIQ